MQTHCPDCGAALTVVGKFCVCPEHGSVESSRPKERDLSAPISEIHARLADLSRNLWWSWQPEIIDIFRSLHPEFWFRCGANPVEFLKRCPMEALELALRGTDLACRIVTAHQLFLEYGRAQSTWAADRAGILEARPVAFFSPEYALHESVRNYCGELGVIAGDHMKSASDLGVKLAGVGLLYSEGAFRQTIGQNGWQTESYLPTDCGSLPIEPALSGDGEPVFVSVGTSKLTIVARVWRLDVGRSPLFLLDANIPDNSQEIRRVTARLYDPDPATRIRQQLLLGVGGIRALQAVGFEPGVIHMSEGHSAFAPLEVIRRRMRDEGYKLDEALREVAQMGVLTMHTAHKLGHDRFSPSLVEEHLGCIREELGIGSPQMLGWGRIEPRDEAEFFSPSILGLRLSRRANGISTLHGHTCRRTFAHLWPWKTEEEIPFEHVTAGVHPSSWLAAEMHLLFDRVLPAQWIANSHRPEVWVGIDRLEPSLLWETHQRLKRQAICAVRQALVASRGGDEGSPQAGDGLDPDTLIVGLARRFVPYKRPDLIFADLERLSAILHTRGRGMCLVIAGSSHPHDDDGKKILQRIVLAAGSQQFRQRVLFVPNADLPLVRALVQGVDLWLSTPRRPMEACGTGGQKAAMNGVLNCSILDGWWAEAFAGTNGFAVGRGTSHVSDEVTDRRDANDLYKVLETEVTPLYYDRDSRNLPQAWIARMKRSIRSLAWKANAQRAVIDYVRKDYIPAAGGTWSDVGSLPSPEPSPQSSKDTPTTAWLVFISSRSLDYAYARQVYDFLLDRGISVFFSQETLPLVGNADYRKAIYQALESAKHMIVVASSPENVKSLWVEHEWSSFLNEKLAGRKSGNLLTVLAKDMKPGDLPLELRGYESLPIAGAAEKLLAYVGE